MNVGFKVFLLCAVVGASWFATTPAIARMKTASNPSRAWWTQWWLDCQRDGDCEYNGKTYYFDAAAKKVRVGRAPAEAAPSPDATRKAPVAADAPEDEEPTDAPAKAVEPVKTAEPTKAAEPAKKEPKKRSPSKALQSSDDNNDPDAERAAAQRNRKRDKTVEAELPPQNSNCAREIARSQEALAKYNTCLRKQNLPTIQWGITGTGFLVDGSRPGRQKKMFAIRDGKCLYEQTVSLGKGSDSGMNGTREGSNHTPAGLFGLTFNTRKDSPFGNKSLVLNGGNAAQRYIYAHNGSTGSNSLGCIRLGGAMYSRGGGFERMYKNYRTGVNNVFIFFKDAKAPNGGCGTPQKVEPKETSHVFGDIMGDSQ